MKLEDNLEQKRPGEIFPKILVSQVVTSSGYKTTKNHNPVRVLFSKKSFTNDSGFNFVFPVCQRFLTKKDLCLLLILKKEGFMSKLTYLITIIFLILLTNCDADTSNNNRNSNTNNNTNKTNNTNLTYPLADTDQNSCYNDTIAIGCVAGDQEFSGQDAQYLGNIPNYVDNEDGTISDVVTGLMWFKTPDINNDGTIDINDKLTKAQMDTFVEEINNEGFAGYNDWRLPQIKELYSLILFSGTDPSSGDESNLIPFIDIDYFDFAYGDTANGERTIDSQYGSANLYVGSNENSLLFGVNFADGRIKGYGLTGFDGDDKTFLVLLVRGNPDYGINNFQDNGDSTISDLATELMWSQDDSDMGMNWADALAWIETKNNENYLGYNDWRLPNIKELQSIIDYSRSPDTTDSPAIDPIFNTTSITNERNETDYPYFWSSTTHVGSNQSAQAASYVSFGRALGYMNNNWVDVHGAGAQRSDPKAGNPEDYPEGFGPQGDAIRIFNYVRPVRGGAVFDDDLTAPVTCGNEVCDDNEDEDICPQDCLSTSITCGDGTCSEGETTETCPQDCQQQGPVTCTQTSDCEEPGNCPEEALLGCSCEPLPNNSGSGCIPQCNDADDCPQAPDGTIFQCVENLCVPGQ